MKKLSLFSLLAIGLLLSQCRKEQILDTHTRPSGKNNEVIQKGGALKLDAFGKISDESGNPISGVQVTISGQNYFSDDNGIVELNDVTAHDRMAFVKAHKTGYFPGSRSFIPQQGVNRFEIMLIAKGQVHTIDARNGGIVQEGNARVEFGTHFIDANGNPYKGQVKVRMKHLSPDDPNLEKIMPGDLRGVSDDGEQLLESYGMLAVELSSPSGMKLEPWKGDPATIRLKVPASFVSRAPSTIPLWHFDENSGVWIEEGEANLINGEYVGKVTHFSYWNCDRPYDLTRLDAQIVTGTKDNVPCGVRVEIIRTNGERRSSLATSSGKFGGLIPANEQLELNFYLENKLIGKDVLVTGSESTLSKTFEMTLPKPIIISGEVTDCDGNPVLGGEILYNFWNSIPIENGKYSLALYAEQGTLHYLSARNLERQLSNQATIKLINEEDIVHDFIICSSSNNGNGGIPKILGDCEISFTIDGQVFTIEGKQDIYETDSMMRFRGGKAANDFGSKHEFLFAFYKDGPWTIQNQFSINSFGGVGGYSLIDLGDGRRMSLKNVQVNVEQRSPYRISFSGTYTYYDRGAFVDIEVKNGLMVQK